LCSECRAWDSSIAMSATSILAPKARWGRIAICYGSPDCRDWHASGTAGEDDDLVLLGAVSSNLGVGRGLSSAINRHVGKPRRRCGSSRCDLVVASDVQAVTLPAGGPVYLRCCSPWLSAADRCCWMVRGPSAAHGRAGGGHGRRGRRASEHGGDGHQLGRRVRPVHDDPLPRWQEPGGLAADRVLRP
jgi:hypothetical protein